jgi:glycosyltransferase involved in cell wall biosynthesis
MTQSGQGYHHGIAFVGDYLPRNCGIATFTHDLAEAVARQTGRNQPVIVVAMNDTPKGYAYPDRVKFEVRQDYQIDYSRAADFLNFSRIDAVCLQHEYGIFGGDWGSNLLTLLRDLHRPFIVTCHTVIRDTESVQKEVFEEIAARAAYLIVMSDLAASMLQDIYKVPSEKIMLIPHGIHDVPFIDPSFYKDKFGVEGRDVLLTFGLLHRKKGIEYMIEALPAIVERRPKVTYLVLGATHPHVVKQEGESYRLSLQRRVRELGLEDHMLFHPRFVELDELLEYLGAADICVTPYLNLEQVSSGALAYAMGSGKAVVSTPYWHAKELLSDDRGRLVPLRDSEALSREINALLDDEVVMSSVRKKAYMHTRAMVWDSVGKDYVRLLDEVRSHVPRTIPTASSLRRPLSPTNLPTPRVDHLVQLCDDTGPAHHARYTIPDWSYGYRLDHAASTLVASTKFYNIFGDSNAARIAGVCMGLLQLLIGGGREPADSLSYTRDRVDRASDASRGKALWALGYVVSRSRLLHSAAANDLLQELGSSWKPATIMGRAYGILGAANYLMHFSGASEVRRTLSGSADELAKACETDAWMDQWEAADWPVAAQAVIVAAQALENAGMAKLGKRMIGELREATSDGTVFLRRGDNPDEEELPVTAATFIEALGAAYKINRTEDTLHVMRAAADWFLGANDKSTAIYDFETGGCYDALTASGLNRNQGTEATTFCLLAFLTLTRIASIGLPTPPAKSE